MFYLRQHLFSQKRSLDNLNLLFIWKVPEKKRHIIVIPMEYLYTSQTKGFHAIFKITIF